MLTQGDRRWISDDPDAFIEGLTGELVALSEGPGLVESVLVGMPHLTYLGSLARGVNDQDGATDIEVVVAFVTNRLLEAGAKNEPALRVALGIGVSGANRHQRQNDADRHLAMPYASKSTIDRRLNRQGVLEGFASALVRGGQRLEMPSTDESPTVLPWLTYSIERCLNAVTVGNALTPSSSQLTFWVMGKKKDDNPAYVAPIIYPHDEIDSLKCEGTFGCRAGVYLVEDSISHVLVHIKRELRPGLPHIFGYKTEMSSPGECPPRWTIPHHVAVGVYDLLIDFGDRIPQRIWRFHNLTPYFTLTAAGRMQELVRRRESRCLVEQFRDCKAGLVSGIAWQW